MNQVRTALVTLSSAALAVAGLAVPSTAASASPPPTPVGPPSSTVTEWAGIALSTVYPLKSVPDGALYLGFTSLAVYDAVLTAKREHPRHGWVSARAAAATAAHDVLVEYFPGSAETLESKLTDTLGSLRDSPAKTAGMGIGATAADDMIDSRVGDGRGSAITYTKTPAIGIWRPTLPNEAPMALPWFGHVKPLLLTSPTQIQVDGPDALTSSAYAADYNEVRLAGAATGSTRTAAQTATAEFYNANVNLQAQRALITHLASEPLGVVRTARLFALINASVADALITTWRLKLDLGYWRPLTAIQFGDADGNPGTTGDENWLPLANSLTSTPAGTPPYPEYPSGHASVVNAFVESYRLTMGTDATDLTLPGPAGATKHYTSVDVLSDDALNARIWLGIHFRDAMDDALYIGEEAARLADSELP